MDFVLLAHCNILLSGILLYGCRDCGNLAVCPISGGIGESGSGMVAHARPFDYVHNLFPRHVFLYVCVSARCLFFKRRACGGSCFVFGLYAHYYARFSRLVSRFTHQLWHPSSPAHELVVDTQSCRLWARIICLSFVFLRGPFCLVARRPMWRKGQRVGSTRHRTVAAPEANASPSTTTANEAAATAE